MWERKRGRNKYGAKKSGIGNREWGVGSGEWEETISFPIPHSPLPTPDSRFFCLLTARCLDRRGSTRTRTHAGREMARRFAVSVRRASEAPQKSLLQNLAPTVRP